MNYIGIDPGLSGAVGIITLFGTGINSQWGQTVWDIPTFNILKGEKKRKRRDYNVHAMVCFMECYRHNSMAVIEEQAAFPKNGVVGAFSVGRGYGIWLGILEALKIPYQVVRSQTWKSVMLSGTQKDKEASRLIAQRMFPKLDFGEKASQDRAEAILLAEYLKRISKTV